MTDPTPERIDEDEEQRLLAIDGYTPEPWVVDDMPGDWGLAGHLTVSANGQELAVVYYETPYCIGEKRSVVAAAVMARRSGELIAAAPSLQALARQLRADLDAANDQLTEMTRRRDEWRDKAKRKQGAR